jgi:hypothetical protein
VRSQLIDYALCRFQVITGARAASPVIIRALAGNSRHFYGTSLANLTLVSLTLVGGSKRAATGGVQGGSISLATGSIG